MAEIILTQAEADSLIKMEKHRTDDKGINFPDLGGEISMPLISADRREKFILSVTRGRIDLKKVKYQNIARKVIILVRLELAGPLHRNPDGDEIPCPHIHIYKEGYGDKWAFPIPNESFSNISDTWKSLEDFMIFCNITKPPKIRKGLFT